MDNSPLRAMVVDDMVDSADSLSHLLDAMGCRSVPAYDAASALKAAMDTLPQLIFLDLNLGPENGVQVLGALKRVFPRGAEPTFVCLTGYGDPQTMRHCREAGFDLFLMKPISIELLRQVLDGERARRSTQPAAAA